MKSKEECDKMIIVDFYFGKNPPVGAFLLTKRLPFSNGVIDYMPYRGMEHNEQRYSFLVSKSEAKINSCCYAAGARHVLLISEVREISI